MDAYLDEGHARLRLLFGRDCNPNPEFTTVDQWKCVESTPTILSQMQHGVGVAMRHTTASPDSAGAFCLPESQSFASKQVSIALSSDLAISPVEFNTAATSFADADAVRTLRSQDGVLLELTRREVECLSWAANGKSEWEISQILGISEHTSEKHLLNAKTKLGTVNRVHAVAEAIRRGYIK